MNRDQDFFLQFGETGTSFWTGVVEDRDDPALMGRVRVRIFGIHPMDRTEVPTDTLPWATVILPTTESAMSGIGSAAPAMVEGTWVVGFFRDGISCQDPIVFGCVLTNSAPKWTGPSRLPSPEDLQQSANSYATPSNRTDVYKETIQKFSDNFSNSGVIENTVETINNTFQELGYTSINDFTSLTKNEIGLISQNILDNSILPKLNEVTATEFSLREPFSETTLRSLLGSPFQQKVSRLIFEIVGRENISEYTLSDDVASEIAQYSVREARDQFNKLTERSVFFAPVPSSSSSDVLALDGDDFTQFSDIFNNFLDDIIDDLWDIIDDFFKLLPIESLFNSILGFISAPFTVFGNFLNEFWDEFATFVTQGFLQGLFFFEDFESIIPEPPGFSFGDIRRGVQPGTIIERPNTKYPLLSSESDIHRVGRGDQTVFQPGGMKYHFDRERDPLFNEPEMDYDAVYPYNHYKETESGHIFEYDDTPSKERIQERHKSGTGYHINPDGSKKEIVKGENFVIYVNNNKVHVQGRMELYVDKDTDISINGQADISIAEDANIQVGNDAKIDVTRDTYLRTGRDFEVQAERDVLIRAGNNIKIESGEKIELISSEIFASATGTAEISSGDTIRLGSGYVDVIGESKIDLNTNSSYTSPASITDPVAPKPVVMHEDGKLPEHEYFEKYEDVGADGADRWVETEDVKGGLESGAMTSNDTVYRNPDIVLPKETDTSDPVEYQGSSNSKYSIEWIQEFFEKHSDISTSNPNHPIYKLKISSNIYVGDLTIWCLFKHYIPEDANLIYNLSHLANTCVDPLYGKYGGLFHNKMNRPKGNLLITCGYRRTGSRNHTNANAFDFQLPHIGKGYYYDEALYIKNNIGSIDKLLLEYKTTGTKLPWIHLQSGPNSARGIICTYMNHVKHSDGLVNLAHKNR